MNIPLIIGTDIILQGMLRIDQNGIALQKSLPATISVNCIMIFKDKTDKDLHHREDNIVLQNTHSDTSAKTDMCFHGIYPIAVCKL